MLKKFTVITCLLTLLSSFSLRADEMDDNAKNIDAIWRQGSGAVDGGFTATSSSMLGWGLGLGAGIGVLAAVLHQSKAESGHHAHCD